MNKTLTRFDLYELVWSAPMATLARQVGISDVALAKWCRRADVPIPNRGYWAKRAAGKPTLQPKLPPRGLGKHEIIEFGPRHRAHDAPSDAELLSQPLAPKPTFDSGLEQVVARARELVGKVSIPKNLLRPHHQIAKLLAEDDKRRLKQLEYSYSWNAPIFTSLIERRRLRFLNGLFLALGRCGCRCTTHGREARDVYVVVGDQSVSFKLEHIGAKEAPYNGVVEPIPEGAKLCVKFSWYEPPPEIRMLWTDTAELTIENQISDIAVEIVVAGEWSYRTYCTRQHEYVIERRIELEEEARQRKLRAEREERARQEKLAKEARDRLLSDAACWRQAADIRAFVSAMIAANLAPYPGWSRWALQHADEMDPLYRGVDPTETRADEA